MRKLFAVTKGQVVFRFFQFLIALFAINIFCPVPAHADKTINDLSECAQAVGDGKNGTGIVITGDGIYQGVVVMQSGQGGRAIRFEINGQLQQLVKTGKSTRNLFFQGKSMTNEDGSPGVEKTTYYMTLQGKDKTVVHVTCTVPSQPVIDNAGPASISQTCQPTDEVLKIKPIKSKETFKNSKPTSEVSRASDSVSAMGQSLAAQLYNRMAEDKKIIKSADAGDKRLAKLQAEVDACSKSYNDDLTKWASDMSALLKQGKSGNPASDGQSRNQ